MGKLVRASLILVVVGLVAVAAGGTAERVVALQEGLAERAEAVFFQGARNEQDLFDPFPLRPPSTESPRDTLESFLQKAREAIQLHRSGGSPRAIDHVVADGLRCLDLRELPPAVRAKQGIERALLLLEILDRIELPPIEDVPGIESVEETGLTSWTIPDTEIAIARTDDGPDAGAFQFSARTVEQLPEFYERARHLPYKPNAAIGAYEGRIYSPGPWLAREWTMGLPVFAYWVVLDQTVWQWFGALATLVLTIVTVVLAYLAGQRVDSLLGGARSRRHFGRILAMILTIALAELAEIFISDGINITGGPLFALRVTLSSVAVIAAGWLIVLVLDAVGDLIVRFRGSSPDSVDAQLTSLVVRLLAIVVLIYLALYLAESFGIPAAPLIASLGVGGLALALAVQPTLENIFGGFLLFADKPVGVGEFCMFGDKMGTVEQIGFRSTRVRGLDRTVITVPNADFAKLEITNFTRRDQMLVHTTLRLRYETTPDQLRYVLTRLRELFVAHPKVAADPARARFTGFGESSLHVEIFAYVLTKDYNEFLGIAEDLNLRIMNIVSEAGTGFALPSQTAYLARAKGLDGERTGAAEAEVQAWRAEGVLPFPWADPERASALQDTLDFPPEGSVQRRGSPEPPADSKSPSAPRRRWGRGRSRPTQEG